jgi:hypothetical protein
MGLIDKIPSGAIENLLSGKKSALEIMGGLAVEGIAEFIAQLISEKDNYRDMEPGDVLGVSRGVYDHYGVYVGENRVIHYTAPSGDVALDGVISETSFKRFLRDADDYFILNLEYLEPRIMKRYAEIEKHGLLNAMSISEEFSLMQIAMRTWQKVQKREVFSAEETIRRARSRLGEKSYNLLTNNCEHFAIWCKTGLSKSYQVEAIIQGTPRVEKELA